MPISMNTSESSIFMFGICLTMSPKQGITTERPVETCKSLTTYFPTPVWHVQYQQYVDHRSKKLNRFAFTSHVQNFGEQEKIPMWVKVWTIGGHSNRLKLSNQNITTKCLNSSILSEWNFEVSQKNWGVEKNFFPTDWFQNKTKTASSRNSTGFGFSTSRRFEWPPMVPLLNASWGCFDHLRVGPKLWQPILPPWLLISSADRFHQIVAQCTCHQIFDALLNWVLPTTFRQICLWVLTASIRPPMTYYQYLNQPFGSTKHPTLGFGPSSADQQTSSFEYPKKMVQ